MFNYIDWDSFEQYYYIALLPSGFGVGYEKYTQTERLEQCMYPGAPCSFLDPHYSSSCLQKHNFVRLLAYTYEVRGQIL